jgi:hypothetical protein
MADGFWLAVLRGDVGEVERFVGHDPGLLDAQVGGWTPLMYASEKGHVGVVRWLLENGAAIDVWEEHGCTALWLASSQARTNVVRLMMMVMMMLYDDGGGDGDGGDGR